MIVMMIMMRWRLLTVDMAPYTCRRTKWSFTAKVLNRATVVNTYRKTDSLGHRQTAGQAAKWLRAGVA